MQAFASRRARLRASALATALSVAAFAACIDPIHLYPAGTGGAAGSTGSAAPACRSNTDCKFPTAVCDTVKGACVGCLVVSDCAYAPDLVCNQGTCECSPDAVCDAGTGGTGGGGTGGSDGGVPEGGDDGGPDASCLTCAEALAQAGTVCPGPAATAYALLKSCGCTTPGLCTSQCATTLCMDQPFATLSPCGTCLTLLGSCTPGLDACMIH